MKFVERLSSTEMVGQDIQVFLIATSKSAAGLGNKLRSLPRKQHILNNISINTSVDLEEERCERTEARSERRISNRGISEQKGHRNTNM